MKNVLNIYYLQLPDFLKVLCQSGRVYVQSDSPGGAPEPGVPQEERALDRLVR